MIALWATGVLAATDPLLEGISRADEVKITRGPAEWITEVHGERYTLPAPRTAAEEALLRAWIASLLQEIEISPVVPTIILPALPAESHPQVVLPREEEESYPSDVLSSDPGLPESIAASPAPEEPQSAQVQEVSPQIAPPELPPPPPSPPSAPASTKLARDARRMDLRWLAPWVGPALVLRSAIDPGGSLAVGLSTGEERGFGIVLSGVAPRPTRWGEETRLGELCADIELWSDIRELRAFVGAGTAIRRWSQGTETVAVTPMPQASLGALLPTLGGGLFFGGAAEVDLGRTSIGPLGDRSSLLPVSARIEVRIVPRIEPKAEDAT